MASLLPVPAPLPRGAWRVLAALALTAIGLVAPGLPALFDGEEAAEAVEGAPPADGVTAPPAAADPNAPAAAPGGPAPGGPASP